MDAIARTLRAEWRREPLPLEPLPAGHTNSSYVVHGGGQTCVLRVSWAGKTRAQVERETRVLRFLRGRSGAIAIPLACPTVSGADHIRLSDGRWLHLFRRIDGIPGLPADSAPATADAMRSLEHMHGVLAGMGTDASSPVAWLRERHARVRARRPPPLPAGFDTDHASIVDGIGACLADADRWLRGPVQWLHGDYHPGNVLFVDRDVAGVVDFDEVGQGSAWLEVAFAAFAFSRDATVEDRFVFDPSRWQHAVEAYAGASRATQVSWLREHRDALLPLFCADQLLIHLEAAQRGLWSLTPGIGFLACWHAFTAQASEATSAR